MDLNTARREYEEAVHAQGQVNREYTTAVRRPRSTRLSHADAVALERRVADAGASVSRAKAAYNAALQAERTS